MKSIWTHNGRTVGVDNRIPSGYSRLIELRETKTLWIGRDGSKWRKSDGYRPGGGAWPDKLDLTSVVKQ